MGWRTVGCVCALLAHMGCGAAKGGPDAGSSQDAAADARADATADAAADGGEQDAAVDAGTDGASDAGRPQGACVWNVDPEGTVVNGHYERIENDGLPYYIKSVPTSDDNACGSAQMYIYLSGGKWKIGPELGSNVNVVVECNSPLFVESPFHCGDNWQLSEGGTVDEDAFVVEGACPAWPCDAIFMTYSENIDCNACCGTYARSQAGPNIYERQDGENTYYWYFNPLRFRWQCGAEIDQDCSTSTIDETTDEGFKLISPLQWIQYPGSTPSGDIFFDCNPD